MESLVVRCCLMYIYNSKVYMDFCDYFNVIVFVEIKGYFGDRD